MNIGGPWQNVTYDYCCRQAEPFHEEKDLTCGDGFFTGEIKKATGKQPTACLKWESLKDVDMNDCEPDWIYLNSNSCCTKLGWEYQCLSVNAGTPTSKDACTPPAIFKYDLGLGNYVNVCCVYLEE